MPVPPEPLLKREFEPNGRKYKDLNDALNSVKRRWINVPAHLTKKTQAWNDSRNSLIPNVRTSMSSGKQNWHALKRSPNGKLNG